MRLTKPKRARKQQPASEPMIITPSISHSAPRNTVTNQQSPTQDITSWPRNKLTRKVRDLTKLKDKHITTIKELKSTVEAARIFHEKSVAATKVQADEIEKNHAIELVGKDNRISAMKELHNVEVGKIKKKLADVGAKNLIIILNYTLYNSFLIT